MASNGSGNLKHTPAQDLAAYDRLPAQLREALATTRTKVSAVGALMQFGQHARRYGADDAIDLTLGTIAEVDERQVSA